MLDTNKVNINIGKKVQVNGKCYLRIREAANAEKISR